MTKDDLKTFSDEATALFAEGTAQYAKHVEAWTKLFATYFPAVATIGKFYEQAGLDAYARARQSAYASDILKS
jgi:tRNA(His) 5'-end guanylyltransferase